MGKIRKQFTILCLVLTLLGQGAYVPFAHSSASDNASIVVQMKSDISTPSTITNLVSQTNSVTEFSSDTGAGKIRLTWTAPSDNPDGDKVYSYIVKYATFSIADLSGSATAWWNHPSVMQLTSLNLPSQWGIPENKNPGDTELMVLNNLTPGQYYWFGIESVDRCFNHSFMDVQAQGVGTQANAYASTSKTPPEKIADLSALADISQPGTVKLTWTAPGNDGTLNKIIYGKYRIMYSSVPTPGYFNQGGSLYPYNPVWTGATSIYLSTTNVNPGDKQTYFINNLPFTTTNYYFCVWTADEWYLTSRSTWNWTYESNPAWVNPYYELPPGPVQNLIATPSGSVDVNFGSYIRLNWTNPADPDLKEIRIYPSTTTYPSSLGTSTYTALTPSFNLYSFFTLVPRTTYFYTVVAVDQSNQLSAPATCYAFTSIDPIAPDPVINLTGLADANRSSGTFITLDWIHPDPNKTMYRNIDWSNTMIYISTQSYVKDGGLPYNGQQPVTLQTSSTWYAFTRLIPQNTYYIEVRTYDQGFNFSVSTISIYTWKDIVPPEPFKLLVTTASYSDVLDIGCEIKVGWKYPDDKDLDRIYITYLDSRYPSDETEGIPIMHRITRTGSAIDDSVSYNELTGNTTYYIGIFLYDWSGNMSSASIMGIVNVPKDNNAPFVPLGITSSRNINTFTITWDSVTWQNLVTDITSLSAITKPVPRSTELYRYQIYESDGMTDWTLIFSTKPTESGRTFTVPVSTETKYYRVRAIDICGNYNDSMIVDNSDDLNMFSLYTDNSYVKMSKDINSVVKDIYFNWTRNEQEEKGPVFKSYVIEPSVISNGRLLALTDSFTFNKPEAEIAIKYDAQIITALGNNDPAKWLSLFFYNGIEWLKLTSTVDTANLYVKSDVKYIGRYQIRYVLNPAEFTYYKVMPRVITPNNDGENDRAFFRFENPKQTGLKIKIFDMTGSVIKDFGTVSAQDSMNNGTMTYWNGTDTQGKLVAPGTYIYQIEGEGKVFHGTIIVAR